MGTVSRLLPFPVKYRVVDQRYTFNDRADSKSLNIMYPFPQSYWPRRERRDCERPFALLPSQFSLDLSECPELIVRTVFKYVHPIDLTRAVSTCCQRWNRLSNSGSMYRDVRVLVRPNSEGVSNFLHRASNSLRRLCIDCSYDVTETRLAACLPQRMNNVTHLDIGILPELGELAAARMTECFPNLQLLNMHQLGPPTEASVMFTDDAFPHLHTLMIGFMENFKETGSFEPADTMGQICVWRRQLKSLWCSSRTLHNAQRLSSAPFKTTLRELKLCGGIGAEVYAAIGHLCHLTKLSLELGWIEGGELVHLKKLKWLEHLHLSCCMGVVDVLNRDLISLFDRPSGRSSDGFPSRLRYLRIADCAALDLPLLSNIIQSCSQLESLGIPGRSSLHGDGIRLLIDGLKHLRFLDLSEMEDRVEEGVKLRDGDLPNLRFLLISYTKVQEESLQQFNVKRPDVIISTHTNYFINWDVVNDEIVFNDEFDGDLNSVLNDLSDEPGFCCMSEFECRRRDRYNGDDEDDF